MESGYLEKNGKLSRKDNLHVREISLMIVSLSVGLMSFLWLFYAQAPITYKNVHLEELTPKNVKFYVENQRIHLIFKHKGQTDTVASLQDYQEYLITSRSSQKISRYDSLIAEVKKDRMKASKNNKKFHLGEAAQDEMIKSRQAVPRRNKPKPQHAKAETFASRSPLVTMEHRKFGNGQLRGDISGETPPAIKADVMPQFPGGKRGLELYLARNKRTPFGIKAKKLKGRVYLKFRVNMDGSLSDIKVIKGLGFGCEQEAIRLVENMPLWQPGFIGNKAIDTYKSLSIEF